MYCFVGYFVIYLYYRLKDLEKINYEKGYTAFKGVEY
jgi:hypothetical protein